MLGGGGEGEVADVLGPDSGLLDVLQKVLNSHGRHRILGLQRQDRLELGGVRPRLGVVGLINDDGEVLVLEGARREDRFHRVREGLDRDHDDRDPAGNGFRQLLALRLGGLVPVDGSNDAELAVDLLHRVLQLAVQDRPVGDDDDRVEVGLPIVMAQLDEVVGSPGDGAGLAGSGAVLAEVGHAGAIGLGVFDHGVHCRPLVEPREDERFLLGPVPVEVHHILLLDIDEAVEDAKPGVRLQHIPPKVGDGVILVLAGSITGVAIVPAVER